MIPNGRGFGLSRFCIFCAPDEYLLPNRRKGRGLRALRWNGRRRMKWQIPLAAVLGVGGLLVNDASGICVAALFAAALHECGHLLAARWMRIPLRALRVDSLGARLEVTGRMLSYGEEWILCAAGPMASLLASAAVAPLWTRSSFATLFSCASLLLGFHL